MTAERRPIASIVIVGGGTAGWMAAAAAGRFLDDGQRTITLVESDDIGTIGVGEATIPPITGYNTLLGIGEADFVKATQATFKLGIEFTGWGGEGRRYLHPFDSYGQQLEGVAFHQFWLKHRLQPGVGDLGRYSLSNAAAWRNRFAQTAGDPRAPGPKLPYAYHFDATLYAAYLRARAETDGVRRVEGKIVGVEQDGETGFVQAVVLADGRRVAGELFLDCSGFRSLLLGEALGVPYRDWSHWLPCDRAIAVPSLRTDPLVPYTRSIARDAGWQWRIPLQHRTGNGHVYSSAHLSDDEAERVLLANLDGAPAAEPRRLRFTTGMRERLWEKNVVAIGLSGGFVEPLESTSIHLIQAGISRLTWLFPDSRLSPVEAREYNRMSVAQFEHVRDFIILHYKANGRDTPFWRQARDMAIPDTLAHRIELFREKGRILRYEEELFAPPSWIAVMIGQGIIPEGYDPMVDSMDQDRLLHAMQQLAARYEDQAGRMPSHADYIAANCLAPRLSAG